MRPVQLKMALAALGIDRAELCTRARITGDQLDALTQGDPGAGPDAGLVAAEAAVRGTLEAEGIELIGEDGVRYTGDGATIPLESLSSANDE